MSKTIGVILSLKNELSEQIKPAISSLKEAEKNVEVLRNQIEEYELTIKSAKKNMEAIASEIKSVSSTILKNNQSYQLARKEIENLEKANSQMENSIKSQVAILNQVANEYGYNSKQYKLAQNQLQALKSQRENNIEAIKDQKEALEKLKESIIKNSPEIAELKAQEQSMKSSIDSAKKSIQGKRQEILKLSKEIKQSTKEIEKSKETFKSWGLSVVSSIDKALVSVTKFGFGLATAIGGATGISFKNGLDTAIVLEGARVQLSTAVKNEEKTNELMQYGQQFSISTPFTPQEVIQAISTLETYKIDSREWLRTIADASGATNKELLQGVEAVRDVLGKKEFESLEEFGISKETLMEIDKTRNKSSKDRVFKNNGDVKDLKRLELLLKEVMAERFEGGSQKLANTISGVWSTLTGAISTGLAEILGMNNGLIRTGSILDFVKTQVQMVAEKLVKFQEEGNFTELSIKASEAFHKILDSAIETYQYIKENGSTIMAIVKVTLAVYGVVKAFILASQAITAYQVIANTLGKMNLVITIINNLKIAVLALNSAFLANPVGLFIAAIGATIFIVAQLIRNFDSVKETLHSWYVKAQDLPKPFVYLVEFLKNSVKMVLSLFDGVAKVAGWIKGLFSDEETAKEIELKQKVISEEINGSNTQDNLMLRKEINNIPYETPSYETMRIKKVNTNPVAREVNSIVPKSTQPNQNFTITINGDNYGYEDFKEKVAQVIVEISKYSMANVT